MARADEIDPGNLTGKYILNERGEPVEEPDLLKWGRWMEQADRHIADDILESGVCVLTVFLGIDHGFSMGKAPPVLWETMIFGGPHDQYRDRYTSKEAAIAGHAEAVELAKKGADSGTSR